MKKMCLVLGILFAFCLCGCAFNNAEPEETTPGESIISTSPLQTEPINIQTAPPETQPPVTEPPTTESTQPQMIAQPIPEDDAFVRVKEYIPDIVVDLRYATDNNFTDQQIYNFSEAWLRYGTVKKLLLVQEELRQNGLYLKIWDGFRPPSAQFKLWEICPDPTYVSNPNNGFSSHSRGNTVDITLVYSDGTELVMPTGFDDFSKLADRDYSDCDPEAADNARMLEQLMKDCGFKPYSGEWWHFTDAQSYPVEEAFEPIAASWYYADCNEFISLRTNPSTSSDVITKIQANEQFQVLALHGDFALVEYQSLVGYVLRSYISVVA